MNKSRASEEKHKAEAYKERGQTLSGQAAHVIRLNL
jgi:hypothetical protein